MSYSVNTVLDTTGLICPEPVMLLHKAIKPLASGEIIEVVATDPSTTRDIPKFCHFLGHELLSQDEQGKTYIYHIKKK